MLVECANGVVEFPDIEHELKFMRNDDSIMITFPDHIQQEFQSTGIIVEIKELLHWFADGYPPEKLASAQKLREIADRNYDTPEDDDGEEFLCDPRLIEDIEAAVNELGRMAFNCARC